MSDIANMTASVGIGETGQKEWLTIVRGKEGKYGLEVNVNLTLLDKAKAGGARTFTDKNGNVWLGCRAKVWEPRSTAAKQPQQDLDDSIPW